jgi:four helix bundle protein
MTNDQRLPFQRLDAYLVAKELAQRVHEAKISDAELRDQATRAAKSAFLHLCEGLPNRGAAMRRRYFTGAHNSLYEALGAMDLAKAIGAASQQDAAAVQALGVRLTQLLRALMR